MGEGMHTRKYCFRSVVPGIDRSREKVNREEPRSSNGLCPMTSGSDFRESHPERPDKIWQGASETSKLEAPEAAVRNTQNELQKAEYQQCSTTWPMRRESTFQSCLRHSLTLH